MNAGIRRGKLFFQRQSLIDLWLVLLMICGLSIYCMVCLHAKFQADEYEITHGAFLLTKGQHMYSDFFNPHPPAFYYLMSLVIRLRGASLTTLLTGRWLIMLSGFGLLAGVFFFNRRFYRTWRAGLIAVCLILYSGDFQMYGFLIRPEIPLYCLMMVGFAVISRLKNQEIAAGILLGSSLLVSTRAVYFACGIALAVTVRSMLENRRIEYKTILRRSMKTFIPCLLIVTAAVWVFFPRQPEALDYLFSMNRVFAGQGYATVKGYHFTFESLRRDWWLWVLGCSGIIGVWKRLKNRGWSLPELSLLATFAAACLGLLFVYKITMFSYHFLLYGILLNLPATFTAHKLIAAFTLRRGLRYWLGGLLLVFIPFTLITNFRLLDLNNKKNLKEITYVLEHTPEDAAIIPFDYGHYMFRMTSWKVYSFRRAMFDGEPAQVLENDYLKLIDDPEVMLCEYSFNTECCSERLLRALFQNFHFSGIESLLVRNGATFCPTMAQTLGERAP